MARRRLGKRKGKSRARSPEIPTGGPPGDRDGKTGRFLTLNKAARTHGLSEFRKKNILPPDLQLQLDAFTQQLLTDQGGAADCSALRMGLIRRVSEIEAICQLLARNLADHGVTSPRGRMRHAASMFLSAVDRFNKLAAQLGLERKQKPVGTIEDYIKQHQQQEEEP